MRRCEEPPSHYFNELVYRDGTRLWWSTKKVIDSPPYAYMISPQNKLSQTSKVGKWDLKVVGAIQTVHHDVVTSEVDRFAADPAMKARTLKLDSPMSELQTGGYLPSNGLEKSLSKSNMGINWGRKERTQRAVRQSTMMLLDLKLIDSLRNRRRKAKEPDSRDSCEPPCRLQEGVFF